MEPQVPAGMCRTMLHDCTSVREACFLMLHFCNMTIRLSRLKRWQHKAPRILLF
jgi:hypothetical protein